MNQQLPSVAELPVEASPEPSVLVSFDLRLGQRAREERLVYDVDYDLLRSTLLAGGMTEEDIIKVPTIIAPTDIPSLGGLARGDKAGARVDTLAQTGTYIELYTYGGTGEVSTKEIAHEARHTADRLHVGRSAFVSERAKSIRKTLVGIGSAAIGVSVAAIELRGNLPPDSTTLDLVLDGIIGAQFLFHADLLLSMGLQTEYRIRKQERRARKAENGVEERNVLRITGATEAVEPPQVTSETRDAKLSSIKSGLRLLLWPNLNL